MGCFSFLCKKCEEPVNSDSFSGEHVSLFLLEGGVVIEEMTGEYDSYGRVFNEEMDSVKWETKSWNDVCTLMFDEDKQNGIAAIHTDCYTGDRPNQRSDSDPDQGWGPYKHTTSGKHSHVVHKPISSRGLKK